MPETPAWQYDQFPQIGTDYGSPEEVEAYDKRMSSLRNIDAETSHIIEALELKPGSTVIELGAGTGEFAIAAARRCSRVYAVDISQVMLHYAARKAHSRAVGNIEFVRPGHNGQDHGDVGN